MFPSFVTRRTTAEQIKASFAESKACKQVLQLAFATHFCVLKMFFFSLSAQKNLRVKSQFIGTKSAFPGNLWHAQCLSGWRSEDRFHCQNVLQPSETTFDWGGPWKPLIRNYLKCSGEYLSLPFSPHFWGWKIHPCFQLLFTLKAAAWTWRSDQNSCCIEPETHCSLRTGSCRKRWYWSRAQHCILLTRHSQVHFSYRYNTGA